MTKKKLLAMILSIIMVCAMVMSLTACGGDNNDPTPDGGSDTPAQKYATLQKSWDEKKGEKSATDALTVVLSMPFGEEAIEVTVEGSLTRNYNGSEISEISGTVTSVKVEGLSGPLDFVKGFVSSLDLNKLIKKGGKDAGGDYYETKNGKLYYEVDEDKKYYWYANDPDYIFEDDSAVQYKYISLVDSDNNIFISDDNGLVSGAFSVDEDGTFAAEYALNVLGIAMNGNTEIDSEIVNMGDIKDLMEEFEIELDLDAISVYDLTAGDITANGNNYQSSIKFAKATSGIIAQLDSIYEDFMLGTMDSELVDVYNGFADEKVSAADVKDKAFDPARKLIKAFAKKVFGTDSKSLSEMLFTLLTMSDSKVTVKPNSQGTKIKSVEGQQIATLTIDSDLIDKVIAAIDEQELIETENGLKEMKPFADMDVALLQSMTVGALIEAVSGMLFNDDGELVITLKIGYKTTLTY